MVQIARDMLAAAGCAPRPIWFTEVGWPSYELSEDQVGRFAARSLLLTARDGVDAWCWYTFWDNEPSSGGIRPHENYFGMYGWKGPDNTVRRAKPAWHATTGALDVLGMHRFFHILVPDGLFVPVSPGNDASDRLVFVPLPPPTAKEFLDLAAKLVE